MNLRYFATGQTRLDEEGKNVPVVWEAVEGTEAYKRLLKGPYTEVANLAGDPLPKEEAAKPASKPKAKPASKPKATEPELAE